MQQPNKKLKSTVEFSEKTARRLTDTSYYEAQADYTKNYEFIESEKIRLSTPRSERISELLEFYKNLAMDNFSSTGLVLEGIFRKNTDAACAEQIASNSNLISIVAKEETLMLAYRMIKGNKGALTKAEKVSTETFNLFDEQQKELYLKSFELPDGMSLYWLNVISQLIRKGRYPWGSSKRVYFEKPGQPGKLRPITIPPFSDKIVQKAISLVLEAIYEPYFEKMNRSFGFRPNKGCLDAIAAITHMISTNGMRTAVEGDIKGAYDNLDKQILVKLLSKRIKDRKFLNLIEKRLQYDFVEINTGNRIKPVLGIPQGGIDSPYLFNIYMLELDLFVKTDLQQEIDRLNGTLTAKRTFSKAASSAAAEAKKILRHQKMIKKKLAEIPLEDGVTTEVISARKSLLDLIRKKRVVERRRCRMSSSSSNRRVLRIFYVRYADDWILMTNGGKEIATLLMKKIDKFLIEELKLSLSPEKTLITDITKIPARFLGFELKCSARGAVRRSRIKDPLSKKKFKLSKRSGLLVWAAPDRQRLISRLHMKGFCTDVGYPKTLPWLSCLEAHAIVDRFNSSLRGLCQYYLPAIRDKSAISRWVYILRYACLKTLAQKYKISISKVFKRFGHNMHNKSDQTVRIRVVQTVRGESYFKDWVLLTYKDLVRDPRHKKRMKEYKEAFYSKEKEGVIGQYPLRVGAIPAITSDSFLEKITWVSWRTSAA